MDDTADGGHSLPNEQNKEILENAMKATYDRDADIVRIILSDSDIEESDEWTPGVIADYDENGGLAGLEILDASTRVAAPQIMEYSIRERDERTA